MDRCVFAAVEDESHFEWPCYECSKRFRSSAELQKHLDIHDGGIVFDTDTRNDPECLLPGSSRRVYRRKQQAPVTNGDSSVGAGQNEDASTTTVS